MARPTIAHPLLEGVDGVALRGLTPTLPGPPAWATVVFGNQVGPLVVEGRLEGHRSVAFTFDPVASGMDKSLSFPLLVSNASAYLLSQQTVAGQADPFDPAESDIRPRPQPQLTEGAVGSTASGAMFPSDRWAWLAGAVVGLLGLEWLVYARRG
jgi:hypothetical protein